MMMIVGNRGDGLSDKSLSLFNCANSFSSSNGSFDTSNRLHISLILLGICRLYAHAKNSDKYFRSVR